MDKDVMALFADFEIIKQDIERSVGECEVCQKKKEVVFFYVRDTTKKEYEETRLQVCRKCTKSLVNVADFKRLWRTSASFPKVSFDDVPRDCDELLAYLERESALFFRKFIRFSGGDVTLDSGEEHPLLQSIADQVIDKLRPPSIKQASSFCNIFDNLIKRKQRGLSLKLKTEEEKVKDSERAKKYLDIGLSHLERFTPKTHEVFYSMDRQFKDKSYLTEKQLNYLKSIIEELPDECLV